MRSLKNLVLLGDAGQGINFIAFQVPITTSRAYKELSPPCLQEDPYKVVSLGKTVRGHPAVTADFLVMEGKSALVASDVDGIIRVYEYDPMREFGGLRTSLLAYRSHAFSQASKRKPVKDCSHG